MSKINIMALGGLNENGKNIYTISIDGKILIFDVGIKFAPDKMYGVDYVIPSFKYLKDNKDKIVGLFITHPHRENMGALTDLIREIPDINVYATKYTSKIIELDAIEDEVEIKNLHVIDIHKKIDFKTFSVFPFSVTHSTPESVGYSVNTKDGSIIYMGDFIIDPTMKGLYDMDLGKIAYIGKQGVLCLLCESVFASKKGHTSPKHKLESFFKSVVDKNKGRIIFTVLALHIYTIQEIFNAVKGTNRKIVIMGKELHTIVNMSIDNGYIDAPKNMIGDLTNLKDPDSIIIVSNDRETPYSNIGRIVNGYDKFITLETTDTICFAEPSYDAYEKTVVKLLNEIAIKGVNIELIPKDKSVRHHASSEDIMLLIKLFNPKYYMPIKGEYRYQVENASLAEKVGIPVNNILLKQNGDFVTFEKGKLVESDKSIFVDDVLIDGKSTEDVGGLVLKDREMLSSNGLVLICATLDKKSKKVLVGPEVTTRGFIYSKENDVILKIREMTIDIIKTNTYNSNYADYNNIRTQIREIIGEYLYKETESRPVILTVIGEV